MKILLKIAIVAVAAAFMAGCCNCRSYQKKTRRPLAGTEWQLIQLGGKAVKPEEGKFTVTLLAEGNRLTGVGACNRLTGAYKTDGKRTLKIGPLAATMMACPDGKKEKKFVTAYLGDAGMLRYNSKLPIVVYTPDNVDVKYRVWKAEEKIDNAVVR